MSDGTDLPAVERWLALPAYLLFFLMLAFPMVIELLSIKAALFALVLFILALRALNKGRLTLHPSIGLWTLFLSAASLVFVIKGVATGAPGPIKQAQVYVLWPMIYTFLIAGAASLGILSGLERVIVVATVFVGAYGLDYILTQVGILPDFMYFRLFSQGEAIGLHEGYLAFNLYFLNSLPFLVPYVMSAAVTNARSRGAARIQRLWLWLALGLGLGVVLVSGRRALILVTSLSPVLILGFTLFKDGTNRSQELRRTVRLLVGVLLLLAALVVLLTVIYDVDPVRVIAYFSQAFDPRREQFHALLQGWAENPLLGAGHGASVPGSIRSETVPWAYELYYLALLYQTGLLGLAAYAAGVFWIYGMAVRVIRDGGTHGELMLPTLVGTSCFLIANATDPYLARFDGLWVIFLPLAVINCWLLTNGQRGLRAARTLASPIT